MPPRTRDFLARTSRMYGHQKARAAVFRLELDYSLEELRALVEEAIGQTYCPLCRYPLTDTSFSVDHKVPTSRRGSFCMWNLQVICRNCNEAKGPLSQEEFARLLEALYEMSAESRINVLARLRAGGKGMYKRKKS